MVAKVPLIKPTRAKRQRNAFDLSQRHMFTAHAGMLLPVLSLDLMPHDHVEINAQDFVRTLPMNSAAFLSMRGVYEFYFVPYHQMWSQFDQFITGMKDYRSASVSSFMHGNAPKDAPFFRLDEFNTAMLGLDDKSHKDLYGYPKKYNVSRLMDLLGYGRVLDSFGRRYSSSEQHTDGEELGSAIDDRFAVTPFRILAYNKIYADFYANTHYEKYDVNTFNLDNKQGKLDAKSVLDLVELKYRNSQNDYLTNTRPSMLFTDGGQYLLDQSHLNHGNSDSIEMDGLSNSVVSGNNGTFIFSQNSSSDDVVGLNGISVQSIRSAFAVDKLLSVTMRAGKTFQEQMAAHYGVDIPNGRDGRALYLGGFDCNLQVSDVDQTSGTTQVGDYSPLGGYLGRTTGKGTGSGNGRVVFDAKEHGVLMCIYSLVPDFQFDSLRIDPMVCKTNRFDYFTPEFENLGMQPLQAQYVSNVYGTASENHAAVLGWQPRYSEYKTAVDVNHGQFVGKGPLSHYAVSRMRSANYVKNVWNGKFKLRHIKIDPSWLNDVFVTNYNGKETTDCVFGGCYFNIVKVSDMSVDGMPRV